MTTDTPTLPPPASPSLRTLTEADYRDAASVLRAPLAAIKAVSEVESNGSGFMADGRPKIRFESHKFSLYTDRRFDKTHPNLSTRVQDARLSGSTSGEYLRMQRAADLPGGLHAAYEATSWGMFQVLGRNWQLCGYRSLAEFLRDAGSAAGHLRMFVGFVEGSNLDDALRTLNWARFARGYNGPAYAQNSYDTKMAAAYTRHQRATPAHPVIRPGDRGTHVVTLQQALGLKPDGQYGPLSQQAVRGFQCMHKLEPDAIVGPATWAKLL